MAKITSNFIEVDDLKLHYLEAGSGDPVLLLHGWPTNAQLWRHTVAALGEHRRAIALDLPGSGRSDKPSTTRYSFRFYDQIIEKALAALGVERLGLAVHDLGGPIGLHWAARNLDRISSLALLNTLVFPQMSWAVKAFMVSLHTPGLRQLMTTPWGIRKAMRLGMVHGEKLTEQVAAHYDSHHPSGRDRTALVRTATGLHPKGFETIAASVPEWTMPVRLLYGARDRILPDVDRTMKRVAQLVPHADSTRLADAGHFVQEDAPQVVADALAEFFGAPRGVAAEPPAAQ